MRLFLDDLRPVPDGFSHVARTAEEAIKLLGDEAVELISFDHDLGEGLTGYDVAKLIERWAYEGIIKPLTWSIHSANPVGRANIERAMRGAERHWKLRS